MKLANLFFSLVILSPYLAQGAETEKRAIEVDIRGGFLGFDHASYQTVRSIMGSLVTEGTLEHFLTTARGLEGGGKFCLQFAPYALDKLPLVLSQFRQLTVNTDSTAYSVNEIERCTIPQL